MKRPDPCWETTYSHDRRKHRHRCVCCQRIINAGERVLQARISGRRVRTIHLDPCAGATFLEGAEPLPTWRDAMAAWGEEYLTRLGFKAPALQRAA